MELKGFVRQGRNVAIVGVAVGAVVGLTAPVASAEDVETWTMPALRGEVLQNAVDAVTEAAGAQNVKFRIYDANSPQTIYNYTNWVVCRQNPPADSTVKITPNTPRNVNLELQRRQTGC